MRCSVAMATYNAGPFLERQLASLAEQTRLPDELVVFDDASRDATWATLQAFARSSPFPVRTSRNPARLGATRNFELAFAACSGDLLFLADQDDLWEATKLEQMRAHFERRPELGAAFSNAAVMDADEQSLGYDLWDALGFDETEQRAVRRGDAPQVFARHAVAAGTTLAVRAIHQPLCLPFPELHSAHDAWIAFLVACVAPVALIDDPLVRYRIHGDNLVGIRRLGLFGQIEQARAQLAREEAGYTRSFFEQAKTRIQSAAGPAVPPDILQLIQDKIEHEEARSRMSGPWVERLPRVYREIRSGRYRRYAYGWKSVAQDLFLRATQNAGSSR